MHFRLKRSSSNGWLSLNLVDFLWEEYRGYGRVCRLSGCFKAILKLFGSRSRKTIHATRSAPLGFSHKPVFSSLL
uniref:Uncharacterized protein n=1 Tax=Helianthus annuus TaxID=4232 RepID=A0A251U525_HELAN